MREVQKAIFLVNGPGSSCSPARFRVLTLLSEGAPGSTVPSWAETGHFLFLPEFRTLTKRPQLNSQMTYTLLIFRLF